MCENVENTDISGLGVGVEIFGNDRNAKIITELSKIRKFAELEKC